MPFYYQSCPVLMLIKIACKRLLLHQQENLLLNYLITAKTFTKYLPELRVSLIVGGSDRQRAVNKLSTQPHVVIGTPGRIKDLSLDAQALQITTAKTFVVDEADMTLEFGYLEDIDAVAGKMSDDLQMMVFSATIPQNLRPFLKKYMQSPVTIEIDSKLVTTANVDHILTRNKASRSL